MIMLRYTNQHLRKVDVIANIFTRAQDRSLKTNTTWWEMHGGPIEGILAAGHPQKPFALGGRGRMLTASVALAR